MKRGSWGDGVCDDNSFVILFLCFATLHVLKRQEVGFFKAKNQCHKVCKCT